MTARDLRREQIALLRLEKSIAAAAKNKAAGKPFDKAPVLGALAAATAIAPAVAAKLGDETPLQVAADLQAVATSALPADQWLISLAEIASKGHNTIEALALKGAHLFLQASGGTPKGDNTSPETIASLLMNGPF